jgi:hypothetical protein
MNRLTMMFCGGLITLVPNCANTSGQGSETLLGCATDRECAAQVQGSTCVAGRCIRREGGLPDARLADGATGGGGGPSGGSGGARDSGSAACVALEIPAGVAPGRPYADMHGCHSTVRAALSSCAPPRRGLRDCGNGQILLPSGLPCGSCVAGDLCQMAITPACDCDGPGPLKPFTDDSPFGFNDGWICECQNQKWRCGLIDQSGASCEMACQARTQDAGKHGREAGVDSGAATRDH